MKKLCIALCFASVFYVNKSFGSEAGMPQLNPEFWSAQIFWLILIFSTLYLIIWKIFLPKITYSIENRKSRIVNNLDEAQKLKESAQKKLKEYNKIIENSKNEAKKIIDEERKKLDQDIEEKKKNFINQIEKELASVEKEIKSPKVDCNTFVVYRCMLCASISDARPEVATISDGRGKAFDKR